MSISHPGRSSIANSAVSSNGSGHLAEPMDIVLDALRSHQCDPQEHRGKWKALCPAHDDHNPSLAISVGNDGTVLVRCRSHGCTFEQIAKALGLEMRNFVRPRWQGAIRGKPKPKPKRIAFKDDDEFLDFLKEWTFVFPCGEDCNAAAKHGLNTAPYGAPGKWLDRKAIVVDLPGAENAREVAENIVSAKAKDAYLWQLSEESWNLFSLTLIDFVQPWVDNGETVHKIEAPPPAPVEAIDDPFRIARIHLQGFHHPDGQTLRFHRGEWLRWDTAWRPVTSEEVAAKLTVTAKAEYDRLNQLGNGKPLKVTCSVTSNATQALKSLTLLEESQVQAPCWLADLAPFPAHEALPTRSVIVHLPSFVDGKPGAIVKPTPRFFCPYALDYDFDQATAKPAEWLRFLDSIWDDDPESVKTLQEWFGYCLTCDTRHQKILALIGPKRAGKDTIARTLRALIGPENVAGPTLSSLATEFGCATLIGKPLAVVSDARLSGRTDAAVIVERLLAISGEGTLSIPRKFLADWTGKLSTRFVLISNELPRLHDSSGALASRLIILPLKRSFYGNEDQGLFERIAAELPGILLWAIEGWERLRDRGHFCQPQSGRELVQEMEELSSPIGTFLRDRCKIAPGLEVETKRLYREWKSWCEDVGREKPGDEQNFGRNLRAAIPALKTRKTRRDLEQVRLYVGIDIDPGD